MADTADELRRIASEILECHFTYGEEIVKLAQAWFAAHPADEDQPLTWPWMDSVTDMKANGLELAARSCDDGIHIVIPRCGPNLTDYVTPNVSTRGDLRRLASALGITLKETT